jgi:pilus retraction protein PilT
MYQMGSVEGVLRVIPSKIPTAEEIKLGENIMKFSKLPNGLVLVTGPTGSGKSTTLAAIMEAINQNRKEHIITVEDPIEFVYEAKQCVIRQREVGADTPSFNSALKHILRQDPDIVLVGEMRDLETISLAITAAETGHLVFGTLHTSDAASTVDRVIDVFPVHQQTQVRVGGCQRGDGYYPRDFESHKGRQDAPDIQCHRHGRQVRYGEHGQRTDRTRSKENHYCGSRDDKELKPAAATAKT